MTLLSRKTDYALLILSYLHRRPEGGSAREIAARFGLSRPFVANILKELCHNGFVASHRGVKGGYALQRPADSITVADLIEALDDEFRVAECNGHVPDDGCALIGACPVKGPITELHRRLTAVLRGVTLGELFRHAEPPLIGLSPPVLATIPLPARTPLAE